MRTEFEKRAARVRAEKLRRVEGELGEAKLELDRLERGLGGLRDGNRELEEELWRAAAANDEVIRRMAGIREFLKEAEAREDALLARLRFMADGALAETGADGRRAPGPALEAAVAARGRRLDVGVVARIGSMEEAESWKAWLAENGLDGVPAFFLFGGAPATAAADALRPGTDVLACASEEEAAAWRAAGPGFAAVAIHAGKPAEGSGEAYAATADDFVDALMAIAKAERRD